MVLNNIFIKHTLRIISVLTILLLAGNTNALSNSGYGSWQYYRDISINNTDYFLTHYQLPVNLTGSNYPINANISGADIRFTDTSGNELSYWIENWDSAKRSGIVWVNVTSIPVSESMIGMWYGNPKASGSSSGDATFEFFDDFQENLSKWTIHEGAIASIENGEVGITDIPNNDAFIQSKTFQTKNGIIEAKINVISTSNLAHWIIDGRLIPPSSHVSVTGRGYGMNDFYIFDSPSIKGDISWTTNTLNTWFFFQLKMNDNNLEGNVYDMGGTLLKSTQGTSSKGTGFVGIRSWGSSHTHYDDVRVRKYSSSEPSVSIGNEIILPLPQISISTDKTLYALGETIKVTMRITNPTANTYSSSVSQEMIYPDGNSMNIFTKPYILNSGFMTDKKYRYGIPDSIFIQNGEYKLTATLAYDENYVSSIATFTIER